MKIWAQKSKYEFKKSICLGLSLFLFVVIGVAGCVSSRKTTKTTTTTTTTETTVYPDDKTRDTTVVSTSNNQQNEQVTKSSETTDTTTETKSGHPGILSSTLHAIGWVIALPFRLVGGLIGWIF